MYLFHLGDSIVASNSVCSKYRPALQLFPHLAAALRSLASFDYEIFDLNFFAKICEIAQKSSRPKMAPTYRLVMRTSTSTIRVRVSASEYRADPRVVGRVVEERGGVPRSSLAMGTGSHAMLWGRDLVVRPDLEHVSAGREMIGRW